MQNNSFEIINGNNLDILQNIEPSSIDMICTDIPYGISFLSNRPKAGSGKKAIAGDSEAEWKENLPLWLGHFHRVLKKEGVIVTTIGGGGGNFPATAIFTLEARNLFFHIRTVVWNKCSFGLGFRYRPQYENVYVGAKSKKFNWFDSSHKISDIVRIKKIIPRAGHHPTEKPVELMEHFIKLHTVEGMTVLDPFCGTGATGVAALKNGRKFIGMEIDSEYCKIAKERCEAVVNNG